MIHHYRNLEWKKSFQLRSLDKVPESGMQKKKKKRKKRGFIHRTEGAGIIKKENMTEDV